MKPSLNALTTNFAQHIETGQLIYRANQLTGFYITRKHRLLMG